MFTQLVSGFAVGLFLLLINQPALAQWQDLFKKVFPQSESGLSEAKIGEGLKEALKIGTENTVNLTGRVDGYFGNEAIKLLMPKKLQTVEKGLRMVGYDSEVDEFVLSMNRAAEKSAVFAKDIFWDAIGEMTFDDAQNILSGGDTAATDYFRNKTTDKLVAAFRPVVEKSMQDVGVTRRYKDLVGRYEKVPFASNVIFDVDDYVVNKAAEGLFFVLGQEEKKIRKDPAARVTTLLKEVFGQS